MEEELPIALGPLEGRRRYAPDVPAAQNTEARHPGYDRLVMAGVSHHAAFADEPLTDLKLRLDQRHRLAFRRQHIEDGGKDFLERDEGNVNGSELRRFRKGVGRQLPGIGLLHDHDPSVGPE